MKKYLIIIIPIICVLIVGIFFIIKPKNDPKVTKTFDITITIYDSESNIVYNQKNKVFEENLLDALKTATNLTISTKINNEDEYIVGMNEYMADDNYVWNYYVNDEKPSVGVDNYTIKGNDVFTFKLEKSK